MARRWHGMKSYWVYVLVCRDGSFYVGVTSDVEARLAQHAEATDRRHFTYSRRPLELVYTASFLTPEEAIRAEKQLKGWSRAKKAAMLRGDWKRIQELARSSAPGRAQQSPSGTNTGKWLSPLV
jgi:predicted GIY-YIG superfamily endonuclease